jgi:UDP:flavonoid glycosyltransferase YjiC (YdhE family)
MKVLFIPLPLSGHLNPTIKLAKYLLHQNFEVIYGGNHDLLSFTKQQNFEYVSIYSIPLGINMEDLQHQSSKNRWLESLIDRWTDKLFTERKSELEKIVVQLRPTHIFIDAFLSTDFVVLSPLIRKYNIKVFFLQTMLPTHNDGLTPPLCSVLMPNDSKKNKAAWKDYFWRRTFKRWKQNLLYFGKSDRAMINRKIKQQAIPEWFTPFRNKVFHLGFENVLELILAPQAFDFEERKLLPWQQYMGVMVDTDRQETINNDYQKILEKLKRDYSKIVYCSLGTVNNHLDVNMAKRFFEQQITIFQKLPDVALVLSVGQTLKTQLGSLPPNVIVFETIPQLHLLQHSDLFITHGGLNSTLESILKGVPMLVYPIIGKYDSHGNAARIAYHGVGIMGDFKNDTQATTIAQIQDLLQNPTYKNHLTNLQKRLKQQTGLDLVNFNNILM